MNKIGVIINPHARGVKKMDVDPLEYFTGISGGYADVRVTKSVAEIDPTIKEFKKLKVPYIAVCGGDGTNHHVISRFINIYKKDPLPPFLHLRAGTMNTMPRTINLKGKPGDLLQRLVKILKENGTPRTFIRDTIRVNNLYCFIFGVGMTANFLYEYYQGEGTGPAKAMKTIMKAVRGAMFGGEVGTLFDRLACSVHVDGKLVPHNDFIAVIAATVDDIGIGFKPLYRAYEKDGTFHVLSVGCEPSVIVKNLVKIKMGKPIHHPYIFDSIGKKVIIKSEKKMLYTMDGELYEAEGTLVAEAGPQVQLIFV
jgi:diacylglycerol kinase family enzyme